MMTKPITLFAGACAVGFGLWILTPAAQPSKKVEEITKLWTASPHANIKSEAFSHWNKDGAVPIPCATCHSGEGFRDFIGADGSTPNKVDKPAPIQSAVSCGVCHNSQTQTLARVTLPSGFAIEKPGSSAACMICHQGRTSGATVTKAVSGMEADAPSAKLRFVNIHYRAAAASLFGADGKGGFEYPGKFYQGKFKHVDKVNTCTGCHDAHTTKVKLESCGACHANAPLRNIRTSKTDFDGNGNVTEGMHNELVALHGLLGKTITSYAKSVAGAAIIYDKSRYPYFFTDSNGDGKLDKNEATPNNAYKTWTPRLLQAAYNYQFAAKDPGLYAHNPAYGLQLLYDSIESLHARAPVEDFEKLKRP